MVSAVYPTYTYGDVPERWVGAPKGKGAGKALRLSTDDHRMMLLRYIETQAKGPWFLGRIFTALDIYIWVLAMWRPSGDWYSEHCPKLAAIARAAGDLPECAAVALRNKG